MADTKQTRVFLWHPPRTCSTPLMRAMMNRKNCKVVMEPYGDCYYFGTERQSPRYNHQPAKEGMTYKDAKEATMQPHSEYREVFMKNSGFAISNHINAEYMPEGFQHTFLIRNPTKSIQSLYHMVVDKEGVGPNQEFTKAEPSFKEVDEIHEYVTKVLGQPSVIIDGDELCKNPEGILREYCKRVNMPFEEGMLEWDEKDKDHPEFEFWAVFFKDLLQSKSFSKDPSASRSKFPDLSSLPPIVHETIEECMPIYEKLYKLRIQI